ncbi:hypothetical protein EMGBS3_02790, partial [Anaerolineaceae bacterium]
MGNTITTTPIAASMAGRASRSAPWRHPVSTAASLATLKCGKEAGPAQVALRGAQLQTG